MLNDSVKLPLLIGSESEHNARHGDRFNLP